MKDFQKIIAMRWLKHWRHRYLQLSDEGNFTCHLCNSVLSEINALVVHMREDDHVQKILCDKKTLLKQNRWPFFDGVVLFDCDNAEDFTIATRTLQNMVEFHQNGLLKPIVEDQRLKIQPYFYGYGCPGLKGEEETTVHVYKHTVHQSFGKIRFDLRCDESYPLIKKCDFVYGIWAEWGNGASKEDAGEVSMVVMPYRRNLGIVEGSKHDTDDPKICFICEKAMMVGKDVGCLLGHLDAPGTGVAEQPSATRIIKCCSYWRRLARKRNTPVETHDGVIMHPNAFEEFHTFHFSCLIHWILWNQRVVICDAIDEGIKVKLDEIICPVCCTNSKGQQIYSDSQMSIVKSKIQEAINGWSNNPEELENSSIGLLFKHPSSEDSFVDDTLEIQVYRAEYKNPVEGSDPDKKSDPDEESDEDHGGADPDEEDDGNDEW